MLPVQMRLEVNSLLALFRTHWALELRDDSAFEPEMPLEGTFTLVTLITRRAMEVPKT